MKVFGREPAVLLGFVAIAVKLISAFWIDVTSDQQAWINAVAAALVGLIVAASTGDGLVAAILGLVQAALALAVGFGLHWSADQQAIVLSFASAVVAMFVRTQVVAPVLAGPAPALLTRDRAASVRGA